MHDTHEYVSVAEAAVRLGLSPTTIRDRIRAGTLDAERVKGQRQLRLVVRCDPDDETPLIEDAVH